MRISADILTLMEEHSLIQTIFDSENTGSELYYMSEIIRNILGMIVMQWNFLEFSNFESSN